MFTPGEKTKAAKNTSAVGSGAEKCVNKTTTAAPKVKT